MVSVLAVNNYPAMKRFERLVGALSENGAHVTTADWQEASPERFNRFDGVVLSGSPAMLSQRRTQKKFAGELEAVKKTEVPLLGICFGHQLIGQAFGSRVVKGEGHVLRYVFTQLLGRDALFSGLPSRIEVLESHHEVLDSLPTGFELLARSESSRVAAMKHKELPIYSLQFHPERGSPARPDGKRVLSNFVAGLR